MLVSALLQIVIHHVPATEMLLQIRLSWEDVWLIGLVPVSVVESAKLVRGFAGRARSTPDARVGVHR